MAPSSKVKKSAQLNGEGLPRGEAAYRYIRTAIQGGQFKPGERLREIELAKQIGLSRTPIREALSRLEEAGLVAHDPTRGVVVAELHYPLATQQYHIPHAPSRTSAPLAPPPPPPIHLPHLAHH